MYPNEQERMMTREEWADDPRRIEQENLEWYGEPKPVPDPREGLTPSEYASLRLALEQSAQGDVQEMGDFTQFIEED